MRGRGGAFSEAFFLPGTAGDLLAVHHRPAAGMAVHASLLHVPAFAEEMNKSRRLVTLAAREMARCGVATLVVDLHGCGDSVGDFSDATVPIWLEDLSHCHRWLTRTHGRPVGLWGLRLGCLLCKAVIDRDVLPVDRLLLWQAVTKGEASLNEFLRLKVAASMVGEDDSGSGGVANPDARLTTRDLRDLLDAGRSVEVAGYELSAELAQGLTNLELGVGEPPRCKVDWLEVVRAEGGGILPGSRRVVERWQARGASVQVTPVVGEPFWRTLEIAECGALVAASAHAALS